MCRAPSGSGRVSRLTTIAAAKPAAKPTTISYRSWNSGLPQRNQPTEAKNPAIMPAAAPGRVSRFQQMPRIATGAKAQPSPDQENRTKKKTIRASGSATAIPTTPRTRVIPFPNRERRASSPASRATAPRIPEAAGSGQRVPSNFWKKSRTTLEEARSSTESAVDMMAASTATRKRPVTTGGINSEASSGRIPSASAIRGWSARPAIPVRTAPTSKSTMTKAAITPPSESVRRSFDAMKRTRSCGAPRKASPTPRWLATSANPRPVAPSPPSGRSSPGSSAPSRSASAPSPPTSTMATTGSATSAAAMSVACIRSLQATAFRPPKAV